MKASNSLFLLLAIYVIYLIDVFARHLELLHEELGNSFDVLPLNLHFHALRTVGGFMHGGASCAFHTEKGHDLLIGDLPELQACYDGHFFVGHTLSFD
jgi:hypothetical protein